MITKHFILTDSTSGYTVTHVSFWSM